MTPPTLFALAWALSAGSVARAAPNVVVIMADDLGYGDTQTFASGAIVPTPSLDRLADAGTRFTQGYVTSPTCSPSRAGFVTGRYQQRFGMEFNMGGARRANDERLGLPTTEVTIGDVLGDAGYDTALIGKWHLGSAPEYFPTQRGFDFFWGIAPGGTNYVDPLLPGIVNSRPPPVELGSGQKLNEDAPSRDRAPLEEVITGFPPQVVDNVEEYLTTDLGREAVAYLESRSSSTTPFFLWVSYTAPHLPFQAPQAHVDRFAHVSDPNLRVYSAMISALDESIGTLLDTLDSTGLADDTLVFFLSDNGCATYTSACTCVPARGGKASHLEGGIRVPMIARWPGRIPAGVTYDEPVSALDILPTAAAAAGASLPTDRTYDGVDLLPHLDGTIADPPHDLLFWRSGYRQVTVRRGDWKLRRLEDERNVLHDLSRDPLELVDRAPTHPEVVADLLGEMDAWYAKTVGPLWSSGQNDTLQQCGEWLPFQP